MKMINENTEKDEKDTIYNVSKIIEYIVSNCIKCFKNISAFDYNM